MAPSVQVRLDVPHQVPALPAAIEVAAYRIATEALHQRRSPLPGTVRAVVRLRCDDRLEVSVSDNGPPNGSWSPGVGLHAMRERAAELGGVVLRRPTPAGGQVVASFPLAAA